MKFLRVLGLMLALLLGVSIAVPSIAKKGPKPKKPKKNTPAANFCTDSIDGALEFELTVDSEQANGRYALPAASPKGLVVFARGYGHTSASWAHHIATQTKELGVISVGMDYRGAVITPDANDDGLPESRGWDVSKGAEDSIAAAQFFYESCPQVRDEKFVLLGVSMGGNTSGLAMAANPKKSDKDPNPLFDFWIDVEGAANLTETYLEAKAVALSGNTFANNAVADIERETGGPIDTHFEEYRERTVVARSEDIAASGVQGVVVIHGIDDGLVPYNQSRELATALAALGVPLEMVTVTRRSPESERETTATSYVMDPVMGTVNQDWTSPFAGHASEKSTTHIVMVTALEWLATVFDDYVPPTYNEHHVDGGYTPEP